MVCAAWWYVSADKNTATLESAKISNLAAVDTAWQQEFSSSTAMDRANALDEQAQKLSDAASTSNLTQTVGRSLVLKLAAAQGQGLGSDQPTQDKIMSGVYAQIQGLSQPHPKYTASDVTTVPDSTATFHAFANGLTTAIVTHKYANNSNVLYVIGSATEQNTTVPFTIMPKVSGDYRGLARDIIALPVPASFAPTAVLLANEYMSIADACDLMEKTISDPATGMAGLQEYSLVAHSNEADLATFAQAIKRAGIAFAKGEPGSQWADYYAMYQSTAAERAAAVQGEIQGNQTLLQSGAQSQ